MLKTMARLLAPLLIASGLVLGLQAASEAHTGDLEATAACQVDGTYLITYTLQLKNVPSGQTGHVYSRIGTSHFDGTPTSIANMTKVGDFTGNPLVQIGTKTVPGTSTSAPWAYAFTNWTPDNVKVGSDGGDISLAGNCHVVTPKDASASVTVTPATCDADGSASYAVNHAHLNGSFSTAVGSHTQSFGADSGHRFADGSMAESITYTVDAKDITQHCFVQPPDEHQYKTRSTTPNCKHQVVVTTNLERSRSYVWDGSKYVPGAWSAWTVTSVSKQHHDLTKQCARHATVRDRITDKCNCFMDKVRFFGGPNVKIKVTHPNRLTWIATATGRKVNGHQYLLPSRIGGSHGWAVTQTYKVKTTNIPCPCHKTHSCPHDGPPHHHCQTTCKLD